MTCPECQYQWCWLCEGKYNPEHFAKGKCSGKQFIQADSLEQVREIQIERRNQRGGNYCCSCCCIDMCADTNWNCSFIRNYIGFICLALFAPVFFPFFPIALWVLSVMMGIILFSENQYDDDNDHHQFKLCMVYFLDFIQG